MTKNLTHNEIVMKLASEINDLENSFPIGMLRTSSTQN